MLPPVDLTWMRADILQTMPDTAIHYTRTGGSSPSGGAQSTYTASATVSCRFDPLSERDRLFMAADHPLINAAGILTEPWNTPLVAHQRVSLASGGTYDVVDIPLDRSWNLAVRAVLAKAT